MALNLNYSGTTRFVDDAEVLTDDFGFTGDIAFIIKSTEVGGSTTISYEAATSGTSGALQVVANDTSDNDFNSETMVKLSTVTPTLASASVGDYVKKVTTTVPGTETLVNEGAYVKFKTGWIEINLG